MASNDEIFEFSFQPPVTSLFEGSYKGPGSRLMEKWVPVNLPEFLMFLLNILIFCITALFLTYKYFIRHFDHWKNKGIYYPKPMPFLGNFYEVAAFKTTIHELIKRFWNETHQPCFGIYFFDEPILVLKSPKLIKDVLMKDSSIFCNRRVATPTHPHLAHAIFAQKLAPWKQIRSKLSPLFTSGMLRHMHAHLEVINKLMTEYLIKNAGVIDSRTIGGHFATEMILRSFYGTNPECFETEEDSIFRKYTKKLFDFNFRNAVIQNLHFLKPSLVSLFKLNLIEKDAIDFFGDAFQNAMTSRANLDGKPQDFVDVAIKAKQEKEEGKIGVLELDMAISNAIFFLIAGQDTTTTIFSFTLYELAMNQQIQDKLREEIIANVEKYGGLTFEGVKDNKYLEMCINETMRLYVALPFLDRVPMSDYRFEGTDFVIEKGTSVLIPTFALHRDENYHPNAEKYDPERFLGGTINSDGLNYIPFGEGPKLCLGKRLGILGLSMAISNILLKFKVEKCDSTPEKVEFDPRNFALAAKGGLPVKISPIQESSSPEYVL